MFLGQPLSVPLTPGGEADKQIRTPRTKDEEFLLRSMVSFFLIAASDRFWGQLLSRMSGA
jgi:hypothetical protein